MKVISYEQAVHLARNLSENLYYENDFTPVTFRVFLDEFYSRNTVLRQIVFTVYSDGLMCTNPNLMVKLPHTTLYFSLCSDWMYAVYLRTIRRMPYIEHSNHYFNCKPNEI